MFNSTRAEFDKEIYGICGEKVTIYITFEN